IALAVLFRVEAFIVLMLTPFSLLFSMPQYSLKQRFLYLLKAQSILIALGIAGLIFLITEEKLFVLSRLYEFERAFQAVVIYGWQTLETKVQAFSGLMS